MNECVGFCQGTWDTAVASMFNLRVLSDRGSVTSHSPAAPLRLQVMHKRHSVCHTAQDEHPGQQSQGGYRNSSGSHLKGP